MNDAWTTTQAKLRQWQREGSNGWELRRILADSEHFKVIAMCAHRRIIDPPKHVDWQDWWAFYLERLPERKAMELLLDVWNKDVWAHMEHACRREAREALGEISESQKLSQAFSLALQDAIAGSSLPSPPAREADGPAAS